MLGGLIVTPLVTEKLLNDGIVRVLLAQKLRVVVIQPLHHVSSLLSKVS